LCMIVRQTDEWRAEKKRERLLLEAGIRRKRALATKVSGLLTRDALADYLLQIGKNSYLLNKGDFDRFLDEPSPHGNGLTHRDFWEYYTNWGQHDKA
jgi:hypothetical protein